VSVDPDELYDAAKPTGPVPAALLVDHASAAQVHDAVGVMIRLIDLTSCSGSLRCSRRWARRRHRDGRLHDVPDGFKTFDELRRALSYVIVAACWS
jgi:hypothetical protein